MIAVYPSTYLLMKFTPPVWHNFGDDHGRLCRFGSPEAAMNWLQHVEDPPRRWVPWGDTVQLAAGEHGTRYALVMLPPLPQIKELEGERYGH